MTYQAIARKYRPQTFEEVIGQEPIVRTLTNAIEKDQVAHAYIFSGTRGVGKTTTARILAKALNCQQGPTTKPCGQCPACTEITATTAVDVIEIDAASNRGIDEIRELRENVRYLPARDRFKVFIIDEAHNYFGRGADTEGATRMLSENASAAMPIYLATQYLDQIDAPIRRGLLSNMGTLIALRFRHS